MKTMLKLGFIAALGIGLSQASSPAATITNYYDSFSGSGSSPLFGTTPDISTSGATWTNNAATPASMFFDNGYVINSNNSNLATVNGLWLPLTPVAGHVYTLSSTIYNVSGGYISFGFAQQDGADTFNATDVNGMPTVQVGANPPPTAYVFNGLVNGNVGKTTISLTASTAHTITITLDATDANSANWTAAFSITDPSFGTTNIAAHTSYTGDFSTINYAGFTTQNNTALNSADYVGNFTLTTDTIPEPSTIALVLTGLLGMLFIRRRRS